MADPRPVGGNLDDDYPTALPEEHFLSLLQRDGFRLERILSRQHATAEGVWYDQSEDEWVLLVRGSARLRFADGRQQLLRPGDYLLIPAHCRHRVEETDPEADTVWLALHCPAAGGGENR